MNNNMKKMVGILGLALLGTCGCILVSCAGQRQEVVCDEIEYRYNSMSYSPDQRVFMEEELRACREEEAKKKGSSGQKSIYERYASQDSTKAVHTASDSAATEVARDTAVMTPTTETPAQPDSTSTVTPEPATLPDSTAPENTSATADSSVTVDSTASEVPQE